MSVKVLLSASDLTFVVRNEDPKERRHRARITPQAERHIPGLDLDA